ncbi:MAG: AMP-binding protein [Candidatus Methanomethylophilaceae archaeon]|nr:AMP-binding protein [Candidatus Methanomethylophilaceae archaeon]
MTDDRYFDDVLSDYVDRSPFPLDSDIYAPGITQGSARISDVAERFSCTVSEAAAAVFAYALSRFIGSRDVVFTVEEKGRSFPIRMDCGDKDSKEFVSSASDALRKASATGASFAQEDFERYDIGQDVVFGEIRKDERTNLAFRNDGDAMSLYRSSHVSERTAERFLDVCGRIAEGLLEENELSSIGYLSGSDLELMDSLNDNAADLSFHNLPEMFEKTVSECPDRTFCKYLDRSMTYAEAEEVTRACASELLDAGVKREECVVIAISKSKWYLLAPVAIVRSGACYASIDHRMPDEMAAMIIKETRAGIVLVDSQTKERMTKIAGLFGCRMIDVADFGKKGVSHDLPMDAGLESIAYIQYTSGTTGVPKGAVVRHAGVINPMTNDDLRFDTPHGGCFAIASTPSFLAFHVEFWSCVYYGKTVVIVPDDLRYDIASLNRFYSENGIDTAFLITPLAKLYVSNVEKSPLKTLSIGGEPTGCFEYDVDVDLKEGYGCTEYGCIASTKVRDRTNPSSVGKVACNTKAYILDDEGRRVPYGAVGTLHIAGPALTKGYLFRDRDNEESFRRNPFCDEPGYERMFRVGDTARFLPDGTLGVLGRKDGQVKIRGFRVELTEVEAAIRRCEDVVDVCVTAPRIGSGTRSLVAYVVGRRRFGQEEIGRIVRETKAEHMVPSYVVNMERLPIGRTGKIDRKALPVPEPEGNGAAPSDGPERIICECMSKTLGVPAGPDDDFIALGGDSLKAAAMAVAVSADPGWPKDRLLKSADIMRLRTPRRMASECRSRLECPRRFDFGTGCPMPDGMLNFFLNGTEGQDFLLSFAIASDGWTDAERLKAAVEAVVKAHPILGCRCEVRDGVPWATFGTPVRIGFSEKDVFEEGAEPSEPMDIRNEAMSRFTICRNGGGYGVVADISHVIFDGFSVNPLVRSLKDAYDGKALKTDEGILEASAFSVAVRGTPEFEESRRMMTAEVAGKDFSPVIRTAGSEKREGPRRMNAVVRELSAGRDAVEERARSAGVSAGMLLSAAFGIARARYGGRSASLFAQVQNGRGNSDLDGTICNYANPVPFFTDLGEDMEITEHLRRCADRSYRFISKDQYPMWMLIEEAGWYTDAMFQYFPYEEMSGSVPGCGVMGYVKTAMKSLDNFEVLPDDGRLIMAAMPKPGCDLEDLDAFISKFDEIVSGMLSKTRLSEL